MRSSIPSPAAPAELLRAPLAAVHPVEVLPTRRDPNEIGQ